MGAVATVSVLSVDLSKTAVFCDMPAGCTGTETGADALAVNCPFCLRMFEDARQDEAATVNIPIKDVAEIVVEKLSEKA